jgi:hypothetical protein
MVKIKVLGMGKSAKHNYYIFHKTQQLFSIIRDLLKELGFEKYEWDAFGRPEDPEYHEPIFDQENNIGDYNDRRTSYEKNEYYIEIIFGRDKVFLMIHTQKDRQQKIVDILGKHFLDY